MKIKDLNINFPNPSNISINKIILFNDIIIITITILLLSLSIILMLNSKKIIKIQENNLTELIWTIRPTFILLILSIPSIYILYSSENNNKPLINIKILANQWFWTYEYPQISKIKSNRFIENKIRCLSASNPLILPTKIPSWILISRNDVIHSFSITSAAIKIDAVPGRINIFNIEIIKSGVISGQCSEICGINHRFIPIIINSIPINLIKS